MNDRRRCLRQTISAIETLDDRIVPAMVSLTPGSHAVAHVVHVHAHAVPHATAHSSLTALRSHTGHMSRAHAVPTSQAAAATSTPVAPAIPMNLAASPSFTTPTAANSSAGSSPSTSNATGGMMGSSSSATPAAVPVTTASSATSSSTASNTSSTTNSGTTTPSATTTTAATTTATTTMPIANADKSLNDIYVASQNGGSPSSAPEAKYVMIQGSNVGVDVRWTGAGDFNAMLQALENLGMQVTAVDSTTGTIEGMLPIAQLANAATTANVSSMTAVYRPVMR